MPNTPLSRNPANGQFVKGHTTGENSGHTNCARKGTQKFLPRPVLLINPDGKIGARFASVSAAARHLKRDKSSIVNSCLGRSLCCNRKLLYEDEYVKWADYSYKPHPNRIGNGRFFKGCHQIRRLSADSRERIRKTVAIRSRAQAKDPNNKWGKGRPIPVLCVTTGERFPSVKSAAEKYNLHATCISHAMRLNRKTGGLKFQKL